MRIRLIFEHIVFTIWTVLLILSHFSVFVHSFTKKEAPNLKKTARRAALPAERFAVSDHLAKRFGALGNVRKNALFMLDDGPLTGRHGFGNGDNPVPIDVIGADDGVEAGLEGIGLIVYGDAARGVFLVQFLRPHAAAEGIAHIDLKDEVVVRIGGDDIPRQAAVVYGKGARCGANGIQIGSPRQRTCFCTRSARGRKHATPLPSTSGRQARAQSRSGCRAYDCKRLQRRYPRGSPRPACDSRRSRARPRPTTPWAARRDAF